jgi:signal transduction histidine kinase
MLTSDLQVAELTELDLGAALKGILEDIERGYPISFSLEDRVGNLAHPLLAVGLQRIAREALINVTKHARATHIDVVITELKGGIQVTIADNGVGFEEGDVRSDAHMGLLSMRSRVLSLGGEFQIHSPAEGGTRIEVWVPDP